MTTSRNNLARKDVLESIRLNLKASAPFDRDHQTHGDAAVAHQDGNSAAIQATDIVTRFCDKLVAVNGEALVVSNAEEAVYALQTIIDEVLPRKVALSDSDLVRSVSTLLRTDAQFLDKAPAADLFSCDVGVTGAQWAIAETGTLVLDSTNEFNRLTSLIPETHVCLIEAHKIRQNMGEILELMSADLSPAVTFITGPSRTSDIELTLAIGVHGPRRLFALVIDPDAVPVH